MDSAHRNAWLRFALGCARGRGYAREALRCVIEHLRHDRAHRVEAEVYAFNERSAALLNGLGFSVEGRKRDAHFDGKRYADVVVMGLLLSARR
jgi:RimJ/RimL family protein N-acetyltransferase